MLNENLRKLRRKNNLKQVDIAKFLNISRQAYNHYETGKREPDAETLKKLADFFNVSMDYLLGRDNHYPTGNNMPVKEEHSDFKIIHKDIKQNLIVDILSEIKDLTPEQLSLIIKIIKVIKE